MQFGSLPQDHPGRFNRKHRTHKSMDLIYDTVILVAREGMGDGPPELSLKLLASWCSLMPENRLPPGAICFYGDGVKVLVEGSPVLAVLA